MHHLIRDRKLFRVDASTLPGFTGYLQILQAIPAAMAGIYQSHHICETGKIYRLVVPANRREKCYSLIDSEYMITVLLFTDTGVINFQTVKYYPYPHIADQISIMVN